MIELKLRRRQQQAIYDLLRSGTDVHFEELYLAISDKPEHHRRVDVKDEQSRSAAQSWVAPYITRLNRRLAEHGLKVVPGLLKHTYRLVPLK